MVEHYGVPHVLRTETDMTERVLKKRWSCSPDFVRQNG